MIVLSHVSKVEINGIRFAVTTFDVTIPHDSHPVDDSESGTKKKSRRGRGVMNANLGFRQDDEVDYHLAPLLMVDDNTEYVDLKIYTKGIPLDPYWSPEFEVNNFQMTGNPSEGGPVTGTISGHSSGDYFTPGNF